MAYAARLLKEKKQVLNTGFDITYKRDHVQKEITKMKNQKPCSNTPSELAELAKMHLIHIIRKGMLCGEKVYSEKIIQVIIEIINNQTLESQLCY